MDKILLNMKLSTWLKSMELENGNITFQAKRADMTYGHIRAIYSYFERCGLVIMEKIGREYKIRFTEKGEKLQKMFVGLKKEIDDIDGKMEKLAENRNTKNEGAS